MIARNRNARRGLVKGSKRPPNLDFYEALSPQVEQRFWAKVRKKRGEDACWLHMGPLGSSGYPRLWVGKCSVLAHRAAYALARGRFDPRLSVRQKCGNRRCVRPEHLQLVGPGGEPAGSGDAPGLSPEREEWIRQLASHGVERRVIAERYGVSLREVVRIVGGGR